MIILKILVSSRVTAPKLVENGLKPEIFGVKFLKLYNLMNERAVPNVGTAFNIQF